MVAGISINGNRFRRNLALSIGVRKAKEYLWPFLEAIGPERILWMTRNKHYLREYIQPDLLETIKLVAPQYQRVADTVSDTDALEFLPPWLVDLSAGTDEGMEWLQVEFNWARLLFKGGPNG